MSDEKTDAAEANEGYEADFTWGEPEPGKSSESSRLQHYKSFWYSNEEYFLYDFVYLYSGDENAPFLGKIMRLWEIKTSKVKKIRVRWMYRPSDIPEEITTVDRSPTNKEVFISVGRKDGVENVNDLVVVCGKCKILCTATDKRNDQPSDSQLADAHHFFYRCFDVDEEELYPNLDMAIKELGARKVFNNAWAAPPKVPKVSTSSDRGKNDGSNKLDPVSRGASQQSNSAQRRKKLQKKALEDGTPLEKIGDDKQETVVASQQSNSVQSKKKLHKKALGDETPVKNIRDNNQEPVASQQSNSVQSRKKLQMKALGEEAPAENIGDDKQESVVATEILCDIPEKDTTAVIAPETQQNNNAENRKSLQKKALDHEAFVENYGDDNQERVVATEIPGDIPEKDSTVVIAETTNLVHGLNDSATIALPDDTDKPSLSVDVKETVMSEAKDSIIPKPPSEILPKKRQLDVITDLPMKKTKTMIMKSNERDDAKKISVEANIAKTPKSLVKPAAINSPVILGDASKKLQTSAVKKERQVPSEGFDAMSSRKTATGDQNIGEKKTVTKSTDDAEMKKSMSTVGIKKTDTASKLGGGKVLPDSAKLQIKPTSDLKDNASQTLSKTVPKKRPEKTSEALDSAVVKKTKVVQKGDELLLSKSTASVVQTSLSSKTQAFGIAKNEANGRSPADMTMPKEKNSDYGILKKPSPADSAPTSGIKCPPGTDNSFKSLLDRDRAKSMMLDAKAKPLESKALAVSERRRIFREPTPEEKLEKGFKDGMVIHLKNFDASLTKAELEGALKSLIPRFEVIMFSQKDLPHTFPSTRGDTVLDSGQALLVFRDKGQGDVALRLFHESCVVLADDGRPLLATEIEQHATSKNTSFIGHINLDKFKSIRNAESESMRNAVATSHCSQPNTIEYEMAIQWRVLDEQEQMQWEQLLKKQEEAVKLLLRKHT